MFFWRVPISLSFQRRKRIDEPRARITRIDDVIYVPPTRRHVRVRELVRVLAHLPIGGCGRVGALGDLTTKENLDGTLRAHDRDLRRGPRDVVIASNVLGAHNVVGTAVRLAADDGVL